MQREDQLAVETLTRTTQYRAQGVFLWVLLVIKDLLRVGLLEVQHGEPIRSHNETASAPLADFLRAHEGSSVQVMHRAVRTFLLQTVQGRELLEHCTMSTVQFERICFECNLVRNVVSINFKHELHDDLYLAANLFFCIE